MLNSFIENKEAIKRVIDEEDLDEFSKNDWETMKSVRDSLNAFCEATTMIQKRDASIGLVLPYYTALQLNVEDNIKNSVGHPELNEALLTSLKTRFDGFKYDQTYITATLLHSCYKHEKKTLSKAMKDIYIYIEQLLEEICSTEKDVEPVMSLPSQQQAEVATVSYCFLDKLNDSEEDVPESEELKTKKQLYVDNLKITLKNQ